MPNKKQLTKGNRPVFIKLFDMRLSDSMIARVVGMHKSTITSYRSYLKKRSIDVPLGDFEMQLHSLQLSAELVAYPQGFAVFPSDILESLRRVLWEDALLHLFTKHVISLLHFFYYFCKPSFDFDVSPGERKLVNGLWFSFSHHKAKRPNPKNAGQIVHEILTVLGKTHRGESEQILNFPTVEQFVKKEWVLVLTDQWLVDAKKFTAPIITLENMEFLKQVITMGTFLSKTERFVLKTFFGIDWISGTEEKLEVTHNRIVQIVKDVFDKIIRQEGVDLIIQPLHNHAATMSSFKQRQVELAQIANTLQDQLIVTTAIAEKRKADIDYLKKQVILTPDILNYLGEDTNGASMRGISIELLKKDVYETNLSARTCRVLVSIGINQLWQIVHLPVATFFEKLKSKDKVIDDIKELVHDHGLEFGCEFTEEEIKVLTLKPIV